MEVRRCDHCGKEVPITWEFRWLHIEVPKVRAYESSRCFDLCPDCVEQLDAWVQGTQQDEVDSGLRLCTDHDGTAVVGDTECSCCPAEVCHLVPLFYRKERVDGRQMEVP